MAVSLVSYAFKGNFDKVKECIKNGVDVNASESSGNSALYYAVLNNREKIVKFLLDSGANPNRVNREGYTPVNAACLESHGRCLALLVKHGGCLERVSVSQRESAIESAEKMEDKKMIRLLSQLLQSGACSNRLETEKQKEASLYCQRPTVPDIKTDELNVPPLKLIDKLPHMTLQRALWDSTPVTVKCLKEQEGCKRLLMREAKMLSWIRHPRITLLMAVCLDTGPDKACIILERFERSTLFHVLYKTQTEMHLPSRVNLLVDVAEGMTYLHNVSVVHGFLSSLSVFIDEKMRAKVGNLEYSQEIGKKAQFDQCHQVHENWKSPHQLLCKPASTACDVFSFAVLMWEMIARKIPWSWLQLLSVKEAVCERKFSLPMLEIWPEYVQNIMKEGLAKRKDRPTFSTIHQLLLKIKNKGEDLTSEVLDGAFLDWHEFQCKAVHSTSRRNRRMSTSNINVMTKMSRSSEIRVMIRRPSSMPQRHTRRRSSSIKEALEGILKVPQGHHSPREREVERFGMEIAEKMALLRNIYRNARNHDRSSWAKAVVLTRTIEGDIDRIRNEEEKVRRTKKIKKLLSGRRTRAFSMFNENEFINLQKISRKHQKKDWSKIEHGLEKLRNSNDGFKRKVLEKLREARIEVSLEPRVWYGDKSDSDEEFYSLIDVNLIEEMQEVSSRHRGADRERVTKGDVTSDSDSENEIWEDARFFKYRESTANSETRNKSYTQSRSFAISEFLRETDSFRRKRMESVTSQSSSMQNAFVECTSGETSRRNTLSGNTSLAESHSNAMLNRTNDGKVSKKVPVESNADNGNGIGQQKPQKDKRRFLLGKKKTTQ